MPNRPGIVAQVALELGRAGVNIVDMALAPASDMCSCARSEAPSREENEADAILSATEELMRKLLDRNSLSPTDLVSCLFTCTNDLNAEFPAVAARRLGLSAVPLLCAREIDVPGALRA